MLIQVNRLKKGERFKIHPEDDRVYVRRDYTFQENRYACSPADQPRVTELFPGKAQVYKVERKWVYFAR